MSVSSSLNAADRAVLLDWLAGLLAREPNARAVAALNGPAGEQAVDALATIPALRPDAEALLAALRRVRADEGSDNDAALALAGTFGTLFLGAGTPDQVAHPYASVYRDGGRTHGPSEARAAAFLARHDMGLADDVAEPADHIAVMLAALAHLAEQEAETADDDGPLAAAQRAFAADELMPWLPAFRARVEAADRTGFYAAAARLAETVVADLAAR